jgi:hypothetical protein
MSGTIDLVLSPAPLSTPFLFTPATLGPKVWLRSDLGISLDGSGNVSAWADQSGNGNTVSQASSGQRPAYAPTGGPLGTPALVWPALGNSLLLQKTGYADALLKDVFIVATPATIPGSTNGYMIDFGVNVSALFSAPGSVVQAYNGTLLGGPGIVSGVPFVLEEQLTSPGGVATLTVDGTASDTGSLGTATGTSLTIGNYDLGGNGFSGSICEVIVFPALLTTAQRTNVLTYLQIRYGINTGNPSNALTYLQDLVLLPY